MRDRRVMCIETSSLLEVSDQYCKDIGHSKPAESEACQESECLEWTTTNWTEVRILKGRSGGFSDLFLVPDRNIL